MEKTEKASSYSHILKYTGIFGSVQVIGILINILRVKIIAVLLGPQGVGLISLFNSTVKFISDSTNLGLSMGAVKKVSMSFDEGNAERLNESIRIVRTISLFTAILGTLVGLIASPWLSKYTFHWDGHIVHFICLSPAIGLIAITGGEVAILKGIRQLGKLAKTTIYYLVASFFASVPLYFLFGMAGIVPAIVLMALSQMLITITYSYHLHPLQLRRERDVFKKSYDMVSLGIGFVLANVANAAADLIIRSYINNISGPDTVGLYNAGFMMTMTYAGMIFSSLDADYYPRLSAIKELGKEFNNTVNRQIEVTLLLIAPFLTLLMIGLPILLPMFYSTRFLPAVEMIQLIIIAMYLRAVKLPIAYMPLARNASRSYLLMEGIYAVVLVCSTIFFYNKYGLLGAGMAILFTATFDFLMLMAYMRYRFGYVMSATVVKYICLQFPVGILAYLVTVMTTSWTYWVLGISVVAISSAISLTILRSKTNLWKALTQKFKGKGKLEP